MFFRVFIQRALKDRTERDMPVRPPKNIIRCLCLVMKPEVVQIGVGLSHRRQM